MLTRAVLDAPLQTAEGMEPGKELEKLVDKYVQAIFPYHEADQRKDKQSMKEQLHRWVSQVKHLTIEPLADMGDQLQSARRQRRAQQQMSTYENHLARMVRKRL